MPKLVVIPQHYDATEGRVHTSQKDAWAQIAMCTLYSIEGL